MPENAKISVVMAVYRPNLRFLKKQLLSINAQTYGNAELLVLCDSADKSEHATVAKAVSEIVDRFPYSVMSNEANIGSSGTFARLTDAATGDYIAYCDQDDIWEPDKLAVLAELLAGGAQLAYSDLSIIDENDVLRYASFRKLRRRIRHLHGLGLYREFLRRNSVTGCTMLVRAETAKAALPFPDSFVHDHWLALFASTRGEIAYSPRPLVRYRLHSGNQIGAKMLDGVTDKQSYYEKRIMAETQRLEDAAERFASDNGVMEAVANERELLERRAAFFEKTSLRGFFRMFRILRRDPALFALETAVAILPKRVGGALLRRLKRKYS